MARSYRGHPAGDGRHRPSSSRKSSSGSRRQRSSRSNSTLYERYDVDVDRTMSSASGGRGGWGWFRNRGDEDEYDSLPSRSREDIPIDERTNIELIQLIWKNASTKSRLLALLATAILCKVIAESIIKARADRDAAATKSNAVKEGGRPTYMDPDSHKRNNPFAPEGTQTFMEGVLEVKRVGGKDKQNQQQQQQKVPTQEEVPIKKKRWNPCLDKKYELERHDHEPRHGDICRAKGGLVGVFECPEGCYETAGNVPFCANSQSSKGANAFSGTIGNRGGPCRVRDPDAPPEYRCDGGTVCVMAVGTPKEQFKGEGQYYDDTCDNQCDNDKQKANNNMENEGGGGGCTTDMDCSLSGICTPEGKCKCDPWATGADCSYLNFAPVDRARLGYLNENHSSWGGSIVQKSNGEYRMYMSEILCENDPDEKKKRCGLNNWETLSRVALATSTNVEGPYQRLDVVLPPEHHNPSVQISPTAGHPWHLFSISGSTGPIERMISTDEGESWSTPLVVSPQQNPGPLLREDGSAYLFYRADGMDLPSPTCSDEGIAVQHCPSDDKPCNPPDDKPVFGHTGEDPSVFMDHRGNYHMLFNALPYKCVPKWQQGGHAWSVDGVNWSPQPRIGAFDTTIQFTDGSSIMCERRERPQMVVGSDGRPVALVSGVTGCPRALDAGGSIIGNGRFFRGADDCFTLVQRMMGAGANGAT